MKPFVIKNGITLEDFAGKVHHDFEEKFKTARLFVQNVCDGQLVGKDYILHDKDTVELHL
jgi:ribosome-interacting GTPase 1